MQDGKFTLVKISSTLGNCPWSYSLCEINHYITDRMLEIYVKENPYVNKMFCLGKHCKEFLTDVDYDIIIIKFELLLNFWTNASWEKYDPPLVPPNSGLNTTASVVLQG